MRQILNDRWCFSQDNAEKSRFIWKKKCDISEGKSISWKNSDVYLKEKVLHISKDNDAFLRKKKYAYLKEKVWHIWKKKHMLKKGMCVWKIRCDIFSKIDVFLRTMLKKYVYLKEKVCHIWKKKQILEKRYVYLKEKVWHIFKDRWCFSQDNAEKNLFIWKKKWDISERKNISWKRYVYLKEKVWHISKDRWCFSQDNAAGGEAWSKTLCWREREQYG